MKCISRAPPGISTLKLQQNIGFLKQHAHSESFRYAQFLLWHFQTNCKLQSGILQSNAFKIQHHNYKLFNISAQHRATLSGIQNKVESKVFKVCVCKSVIYSWCRVRTGNREGVFKLVRGGA